MTNAAFDFYSEATKTFEKLIYNQNDNRTKRALNYLLYQKYACTDASASCCWLKSVELSDLAVWSAATGHEKWKCILERLKILKMNHINNQWQFHLTIEQALSDFELCTILLDKMLEICNDQIYSEENNESSDLHSIICCFEFVSHWYFSKERFVDSLLFRQCQLELESKIFNVHPHVAWSLWFIGLIFHKTKEYAASFGYFNRAMNIFESFHSNEHNDINQLQKHISQTKELLNTENLSTVLETVKSSQRLKSHKNRNDPQLLEMSVHID